MKVLSSSEMRKADRTAIEKMGIPSLALMENAAKGIVSAIMAEFPAPLLHRGITIAAGRGNNGGDAIAAARILRCLGFRPDVFVFGSAPDLSEDALFQVKGYSDHGNVFFETRDGFSRLFEKSLGRSGIVIDGLLGTGTRGGVKGSLAEAIRLINGSRRPVVSIDIPSGLSGDLFTMQEPCVKANLTVTLGAAKPPLVSPECEDAVGRLEVVDIGLPVGATDAASAKGEALDMSWASFFFRDREKTSHKGKQGHMLVVAGSRGKSGAAVLCAAGALRAGAGLVTVACPEGCAASLCSCLPEAMTLPLPETAAGALSKEALPALADFAGRSDALALGPGLGTGEETAGLVRELYRLCGNPMAIDADGINAFEGQEDLLRSHGAPRVLTPHPGELGRLLRMPAGEVVKQRYRLAGEKASEWDVGLLVKGYRSFMADQGGRWRINLSGGPHMAAPGVGDVLTGIVGALLARGMEPFDALALGAFWHGAAADEAFAKSGYGILATEIAANLPAVESMGRKF